MPIKNVVTLRDDKKAKLWGLGIWIAISLYCFIQSMLRHRLNNYLIFENTFFNLIAKSSLYEAYPHAHDDANHYGPLFAVFIAPFALLPRWLGFLCWNLFNGLLLFFSIETIKIKERYLIYFIALPCFVSSMLSQQFNPATAALIILSYTLRNQHKGFWSAFFIVTGTLIKLYGIVGLAFFFFVKDKNRFIAYLIMWGLLLFCLPMLFSSPSYIFYTYQEWMLSLSDKNISNINSLTCDISIMGFIRNLVDVPIGNSYFLLAGGAIFMLSYFNVALYQNRKFQLYILASVLMFPVLFSSGSEDCTYIIAIVGVGIWYIFSERKLKHQLLLYFTVAVSFNFPLMLFPDYTTLHPFAIKMISVPYFIVWLNIIMATIKLKSKVGVAKPASHYEGQLLF